MAAGLEPLTRLGDSSAAKTTRMGDVVEVEMLEVGVIPSEITMEILKRDSEIWSRMQTAKLRDLLYDQKDVASAWTLFHTLQENSAANEHHFNVMMKACETSCQIHEMMEKMILHNLQPHSTPHDALPN